MKSTSSWLIFCIAGSLLVLSMLVPYLWNPEAQQVALSDRAKRKQVVATEAKPAPESLPSTAPGPVPRTAHRPPQEPLVILPAVATMPQQETSSELPPPLSIPLEPGSLARAPLPRSLATPTATGLIKPPTSPPVIPAETSMDPTIGRRIGPRIAPTFHRAGGTSPSRATETMTSEIRGWQVARWPYPDRLVRRLQTAESWPASATWSTAVRGELVQLSQLSSLSHPTSHLILDRLASYTRIAPSIASSLVDPDRQIEFSRMVSSLDRRIHVWRFIDAGITGQSEDLGRERLPMQQVLHAVEDRLEGAASQAGWIEYLMLEQLGTGLRAERVSHDEMSRLASTILQRMNTPQLTTAQRSMMEEEEFLALEQGLRRLGCRPFSYTALLEAVEQLEESRSRGAGRMLARACQHLEWSPSQPLAELGFALQDNYRQGNIRITLSEALVNRSLPETMNHADSINDQLMGSRIQGNATTTSGLRVVLVPDDDHWHLGIEVDGVVEAKTQSQRGPATFINEGASRFQVNKQLRIGATALETTPAVAQVDIDSRLVDFKTDYDDMPLLGGLARNMAKNQYRKGVRSAEKQLQMELASNTEKKLNQRVDQQVEFARETYQQRWLQPLNRLELSPQAVSLVTRKDKLMMDYRIAGKGQLAGFGECPLPPAESLFQLQLHESAVNNLLEKMDLDGRRDNLPAFFREIAGSLGMETVAIPAEVPEDVIIELAPVSAVSVRFEQGVLRLQLNLRELRQGQRNSWRNFSIVALYRPADSSGEASLVREGHLNVIGRSIRLGDRIVLQGIFNKVFSRARPITILTQDLVQQPALADTRITHHVIENGWLSIALGSTGSTAR
ncbi:MAG: hypothetical protein VYB09_03940 [Planctomycetota bacterium]|nr:hypothetical protein [Planctomycetota bacterium]